MMLGQSSTAVTRMPRRLTVAALAAAMVLLSACGGGSSSSAAAGPLPIGDSNSAASSNSQVTLSPNTVVIDASQVSSDLTSISANGATYTFKDDSGSLADLATGRVMLLQGTDVAVVTGVSHNGSELVVDTKPASLTQVISSGHIQFTAPFDGGGSFGAQLADVAAGAAPASTPSASPSQSASPSASASASPSASASASSSASASPGAALVPASGAGAQLDGYMLGASGTTGNTLAYQGTTGGFTYSIGYTSKPDGVHLTGDFCYQLVGSSSGTSCGNGLSINGTLDGVFHWASESANISVSNGKVTSDSMSLSGLTGQLSFAYTTIRDATGNTVAADPPVLKIPFGFEFPLCPGVGCGGIPLYSKVELALLVKLGISARNSSMKGGVSITFGGSGGIAQTNGATAGGSGSFSITPKLEPNVSVTPGASATEFAIQAKLGLGLGMRNINTLLYISIVSALGQVSGSAVAGEFCQNFTGAFTISGNAETQLFGFKLTSPSKLLFQRTAQKKQPGC